MNYGSKWNVGAYLIGIPPATQEDRTGLTYRGVGLHHAYDDVWSLTHLNSGHKAYTLYGLLDEVLPAATAIAEAVDWGFTGLDGWKASSDFIDKLEAATAPFGDTVARAVSATGNRSETVASKIAATRHA